jgi:hypothetical protein
LLTLKSAGSSSDSARPSRRSRPPLVFDCSSALPQRWKESYVSSQSSSDTVAPLPTGRFALVAPSSCSTSPQRLSKASLQCGQCSASFAQHSQPPPTSCHPQRPSPRPHDEPAYVRRYSRPALHVDFGFVALASLRLTSGGLRREHARACQASGGSRAWTLAPDRKPVRSYVTVTSVSSGDADRAHVTLMVPAMRSGAMRA